MHDEFYQVNFLVHASVKDGEKFDMDLKMLQVAEMIEADGRAEVLASRQGGGFYRITEEHNG